MNKYYLWLKLNLFINLLFIIHNKSVIKASYPPKYIVNNKNNWLLCLWCINNCLNKVGLGFKVSYFK